MRPAQPCVRGGDKMSEQVIEKYGINFEERAKQILSTEPILAAKDLEV